MRNRLSLIVLAALPLSVGLVAAQTPQAQPAQSGQSSQSTPAGQSTQPGQAAQPSTQNRSGTNYADVFLQKLAAQLGVTVERLKAAALAAGNATIDQGVQAGDLTSDRAAALKERLGQNPLRSGLAGFGRGFGGHGERGHGHGSRGDRGKGHGSGPDRGADSGVR